MAYTFKRPDAVRNLIEKYGVDHRDRFNHTPAMLAARFGNDAVTAMLTDLGAKLGLRAADLEEALGRLSPAVVPPYRTRRAYISCPIRSSSIGNGRTPMPSISPTWGLLLQISPFS